MAAGKKSSRRPSTADGSPQNPSFSHFFPPLRHLDDLALSQNSAGMVFASLHHSAMHASPFDWPKSRTTSPKPKPVLANHQLKPRDSSVPPRTRHSESKSKSSRHPVSNGQSFPNALSSLTTTTTRTSEPGRSSLSSVPSASVPQSRTQYFVEKRRKRHHAFGRAIPYPLSYEHSVLDHHIIDIEWGIASRKSVSHHVFDTPPKRVCVAQVLSRFL
ncbi:hypothetical protein FRB99_001316 [Tulasnella sp. 403]|nr:hypothetical protein FRB99_001316 [Tulasnella sp. 403]